MAKVRDQMSQTTGVDGRSRGGRFGAATPGARAERPSIDDLVTAGPGSGRRRRLTWWRAAALVLAIAVAAGSYLLGRYVFAPVPPPTVRLVVTTVALPAGARLTAGDLRVVTVRRGSAPAGALSPAVALGLLGQVSRDALPQGTFLAGWMLSPSGGLPDSTQALVGLALKPGQLPAGGLAVGQRVLVVLLPVSAQGVPLNPVSLISTTVWDLQPPDSAGDQEATVIVPSSLASRLAGYAARGEVSLVATAAPPAPSQSPSPTPAGTSSRGHTPKPQHSKR
jgi:hypothetical protein